MDFLTMTPEARDAHFRGLDDAALDAVLASLNTKLTEAFSLTSPSLAQVNETEQAFAARDQALAVKAEREAEAADAAKRFAAMQSKFSINDGVDSGPGDEDEGDEAEDAEVDEAEDAEVDEAEDEGDEPEDAEVEAASGGKGKPFESDEDKKSEDDDEEKKTMTASARRGSSARKVGARTRRPAKASTPDVVITAAADVEGFATGQRLAGMPEVTKAVMNRVKGFPKYNAQAARQANENSDGEPILNRFGAASFGVSFPEALTASGGPGGEYDAAKNAIKRHKEILTASMDGVGSDKAIDKEALTAAGYCAPSEVSYTYMADYVVDGLLTTPEVSAPRGGLMTTTGPALAEQYDPSGTDFGWTLTEAQMEAGVLKTCETIVCPEFEDHRLDAVGYCWKIPILTEKAFPELVTDAMRLSSVLYAHKMNARFIADSLALSTAVVATGLGASFTDTLEALTIIAVKERRRWNLGENAVMEVKLPTWTKEVFRADISRRPFRSGGPVTDQEINAEFSSRRLAVEYVTDWAELAGANPVFPETFPVMIYPAGTFVKAVEDVINLSAVYDAASLVKNEYTGVFFEQGVMLFKAGYGSTKFTIPVCTAGLVGSPVLDCDPTTPNTNGNVAPTP